MVLAGFCPSAGSLVALSSADGSVHGDRVTSTLLPLQMLTSSFSFSALSPLPVFVHFRDYRIFSLALLVPCL